MLKQDDRVIDQRTGMPMKIIAHVGYELFTASPIYSLITKSGVTVIRAQRQLKFIMRRVK